MLELLGFSKGNSCFYVFLQDIVSGEEDRAGAEDSLEGERQDAES